MKIKKWNLVIFGVLLLFLFISVIGCDRIEKNGSWERKIENIDRIFFHEKGRFTFLIETGPRTSKPIEEYFIGESLEIIYKYDVPSEKKNWVFIKGRYAGNIILYKMEPKYVEIHVHSAKDIEGGLWNHGKGGKGATTVID